MKIELTTFEKWLLFTLIALGFWGAIQYAYRTDGYKLAKKYANQADSLEKANQALKDSLEIFKAPLTPASLRFKLEYVFRGNKWAYEYAHGFTQVALHESGNDLCTGACRQTNGLWGLHARPLGDLVRFHYNNGAGEIFSGYPDLESSMLDLREWIFYNPPENGEPFVDFIKRRGYNPTPSYYENIKRRML